MQATPKAQRATGTLARIALINERRALAEVKRVQRQLDEQAALREELKEAQRREEREMLGDEGVVSAALLQLLNGSRQAHAKRLNALDNAMGDTAITLTHRQNAHDIARSRQRSATRVAERVQEARRQELLNAQQKVDDDLSSTRFSYRTEGASRD